jgi:hypothetical protein
MTLVLDPPRPVFFSPGAPTGARILSRSPRCRAKGHPVAVPRPRGLSHGLLGRLELPCGRPPAWRWVPAPPAVSRCRGVLGCCPTGRGRGQAQALVCRGPGSGTRGKIGFCLDALMLPRIRPIPLSQPACHQATVGIRLFRLRGVDNSPPPGLVKAKWRSAKMVSKQVVDRMPTGLPTSQRGTAGQRHSVAH